MEMTENGVRSKVKIMSSAKSVQEMINLRPLWTEKDIQRRENLR